MTFEQHMEQLVRRHGVHSVFSDFLTLLMCAFSLGQREEEYLKTIRRYEKPEAFRISEALAALTVEMMCLNRMYGEVAWMNSITNQFYAAWQIHQTAKGYPCITPISEKQSYIYLKLTESITDLMEIVTDILKIETHMSALPKVPCRAWGISFPHWCYGHYLNRCT